MTDVERLRRPSTPRPTRGLRHSRRVLPVLAVVAVCFSTVTISPRPASASLQSARAQASALYRQIQSANAEVSRLGQRFDEAQLRLENIHNLIIHTQQIVAQASQKVASDQVQVKAAAVNYYVNNGAVAGENPLFSGDESTVGAANVYNNIAEGNISGKVAALRNSSLVLTQQRHILRSQFTQAASASRSASDALRQAESIQRQLRATMAHISGTISWYLHQAQAAAAAKALAQWEKAHHGKPPHHGSSGYFPAPPPNSRANIAVAAALRFIGVPYVWGGASRYGVDCSGLVMLAWDAAGVGLPHFSGAQFSDTVRVPLWSLRPGDLLFYGWHGDEHVSMYIGHGMMIEAPYTGQRVHITPVRLGYGFAGAGRVR